MPDTSALKPVTVRSRSRWKRRLALPAVMALAAACFHARILQSAAEILVIDEQRAAADAVLVVGGEPQFDEAAKRHDAGAKVVFLLRSNPGRLERMGILQPAEQITRRELLTR